MSLLDIARRAARAIEDKAGSMGLSVTVCVIDVNGHMTFLERMPGATLLSLKVAPAKAHTAALFGTATTNLVPMVQPGQVLYGLDAFGGGQFVAFGGGVPITVDGKLVGGLGVSGGTIEQDRDLADAGLAAIE